MRRPTQPLRPRSSRRERVASRFPDRGCDPGAAFFGFQHGEDAHCAGKQKTQRIHRVPHPAGVGHDGDALPLRQVIDRDVEVVPAGAGEA